MVAIGNLELLQPVMAGNEPVTKLVWLGVVMAGNIERPSATQAPSATKRCKFGGAYIVM
jgi:hypothetical protein